MADGRTKALPYGRIQDPDAAKLAAIMTPTTPSAEQLHAILDRMAEVRMLLVADLVLDRFIVGRPSRISREAPVLILQQEEERHTPGGGANAAFAAARLGADVTALGAVGGDRAGSDLLVALEEAGVDTSMVEEIVGYQTPTKTRVVGRGAHAMPQQIVRFDQESTLDEELSFEVTESDANVVLVSDYGYGAATPTALTRLRDHFAEVPILVDSRYRLNEYAGMTGATPNQEEAERLLGRSIEEAPAEAALELQRQLGCEYLLLTRGSEGMILAEADRAAHIPAHGSGDVADVTGAGDTVIATFGAAVAAGADPLAAALLANYAGGVVVTRAGTASVERDDLARALATDPLPLAELRWEPA